MVGSLSLATAVLLVGCLAFIYLQLERFLALSHVDSSDHITGPERARLAALLEQAWSGLPEHEVCDRLQAEAARRRRADLALKHDASEGTVSFGSMRFEFQSGVLQRVR